MEDEEERKEKEEREEGRKAGETSFIAVLGWNILSNKLVSTREEEVLPWQSPQKTCCSTLHFARAIALTPSTLSHVVRVR